MGIYAHDLKAFIDSNPKRAKLAGLLGDRETLLGEGAHRFFEKLSRDAMPPYRGGSQTLARVETNGEIAMPREAAPQGGPLLGVCRPDAADAQLLKAHGFDFIECDVAKALIPAEDDEAWKRKRDGILGCGLPLRSCKNFLPGHFRLTGPAADFGPALDYGELVLRRAEEVGVTTVVLGSGASRSVPGDMSGPGDQRPNIEKGLEQFAEFCRQLCGRVEDLQTVRLAIEPLGPNETNLVNYVWQGAQIVREIGHPRLRLIADFFHMLHGREPAESIVGAGDLVRHCHLASRDTRSFPGSSPDDAAIFKPYFDALGKIGYRGGVSCECGWPAERAEFEKALDASLALLRSLSV